jgi:hypothetical protein
MHFIEVYNRTKLPLDVVTCLEYGYKTRTRIIISMHVCIRPRLLRQSINDSVL